MVELALIAASVFGAAIAISDERLIRLNRMMPIAEFHEENLLARCLIAWLGEDAGWTAVQACGVSSLGLMILIAALYPGIGWAVVGIFAVGLALVAFDLMHDGREMRLVSADGLALGLRRNKS